MRSLRSCFVTVSVILLTADLCLAQAQPAAGEKPPKPNRPGTARNQEDMVAQHLQRIFRALQGIELTDPQKQAIEALRVEYTGKTKPLTEDLKTKNHDLKARQQNDPDDKVGIEQMQKDIRDAVDKLDALEGELIDKIRGVLKDDQVQQFNEALGPQALGPGARVLANLIDRLLPVPLAALQQLDLTDQQRQDLRKLMEDYRDEIMKLRQQYADKVNEKLTPEQREQLKKLQDEFGPGQGKGQGPQNRQNRPNRRQQGDGAAEPPAPNPAPPVDAI